MGSISVRDGRDRRKLGFVMLSLACSVALVSAQPKLELQRTQVDAGIVYNGSTVTAKVGIKNAGTGDLDILSVHTSCGCTTVKEPKSVLKPGESDVLEVAFTPTGFRGNVEKYINIESNDPGQRYASVTLVADVRDELAPLTPINLLWLGSIPVGKVTSQHVAFQNLSDHAIKIRSITSTSDIISTRFDKKSVAPNDSVSISVRVTPKKEGYFGGEFILVTDSPHQPRVPMRVALIGVQAP